VFDYNGIQLRWYGHDTFTITNNLTVCIDPYKLTKSLSADIILISHNHFDHLNEDDLSKITNQNTIIVASNECISQLSKMKNKKIITMLPNEEKSINDIKIKAISAYNIDKINPDTKKPFHPKEDNKVGFIVTINEVSVYHTGDSDLIPEMTDLKPDILLVPVSGTYVMTASEAAKAVEKIKPKLAIPMHYGTIVGSEKDAKEFKNLVKSCRVQILTKE
jgi:L-ascorbate metabolism protein UlaG (beta-lactamase superfamily)